VLGGEITPPGMYAVNGSHTHSPCAAGTFNPFPGQSECLLTPAGYFTESNSSTYTSNIGSPGYYYPPGTKYETHFPCPKGTSR